MVQMLGGPLGRRMAGLPVEEEETIRDEEMVDAPAPVAEGIVGSVVQAVQEKTVGGGGGKGKKKKGKR